MKSIYFFLIIILFVSSNSEASFLPSNVNGNIGIGTTTPGSKLQVGSNPTLPSGSSPTVSVKGDLVVDGVIYGDARNMSNIPGGVTGLTSNRLPKAASSTTLTDSVIYESSGNIGIGSVTPRYALDVVGKGSVNTLILAPASATPVTVGAGGIAAVPGSFMRIVSSGGAVEVSGNPQITTTDVADGQELVLYGTSDTDYVTFQDGNGISLDSGIGFTLKNRCSLRFIFNAPGGVWQEISRTVR